MSTDVGPASVIVGNLVQGNRLASAQGRDMGYTDDSDAARKVTVISDHCVTVQCFTLTAPDFVICFSTSSYLKS